MDALRNPAADSRTGDASPRAADELSRELARELDRLEVEVYRTLAVAETAAEMSVTARAAGLEALGLRADLLVSDAASRGGAAARELVVQRALLAKAEAAGLTPVVRRASTYLASTCDRLGMREETMTYAYAGLLEDERPSGDAGPSVDPARAADDPGDTEAAGDSPAWRAEALMVLVLMLMSRPGADLALMDRAVARVRRDCRPPLIAATEANFAEMAAILHRPDVAGRFADHAVATLLRHDDAEAVLTWESIAVARLACGDLADADAALKRALEIEPVLGVCDSNGDPWLTFAEVCLENRRPEDGLKVLDAPRRPAPSSSWVSARDLKVRAGLQAALGHWQVAYETLQEHLLAYEQIRSIEGDRAVLSVENRVGVHEERRRLREFQRQALTDPLTGLANRRAVEQWLDRLVATDRLSVTVAIIDADHFKAINDRFSHDVGDRVLERLSACLEDTAARSFAEPHLVGRLGGEEFIVVWPCTSSESGVADAELLRAQVASMQMDDLAPGLAITVSIGTTYVVDPGALRNPRPRAALLRADACPLPGQRRRSQPGPCGLTAPGWRPDSRGVEAGHEYQRPDCARLPCAVPVRDPPPAPRLAVVTTRYSARSTGSGTPPEVAAEVAAEIGVRMATSAVGRPPAPPSGPVLEDILDGATDLLLVTDENDVITYASARCRDLLGVAPTSLLRRHITEMAEAGDRDRLAEVAGRATNAETGRRLSVEFAALLASGATRMVEADVTSVDRPPGPRQLVWDVRALTPRHAHDLASDTPLRDRLTGLPNRVMLVESLALALARADRLHTRLAAVLVSVDRFRVTWDDVGHRAAEELLLSAAQRLESVARPGDLVARTGVDEFALLIDGYHDVDEVFGLTRDALASLAEPVDAGSRRLQIGASAGIAVAGEGIGSPEDLLQQAAVAIRTARDERPGTGILFRRSMTSRGRRAVDLTVDLDQAIRAGHLRPVYQPIVHLETGRLTGFEALARWDHPERGPVSPATFITLAEETGLIVDLGRHIMLSACQQMEAWRQQFPERILDVAVNVSPRQLTASPLVEHVRDALVRSGFSADRLTLEITESALHHDVAAVQHVLGKVRDLGVETAMDDFGTGYSSLAYLRRLPLGILKIDKSFVDDREGSGPRLLAAVIGIGTQLGMATVAEGIEEPDQLEAVWSAGCTFGQGFLISRPLEAEAAEQLLTRQGPIWAPAYAAS